MSLANDGGDSFIKDKDIQDDWQEVEFRPSPTTSASPDVADDAFL